MILYILPSSIVARVGVLGRAREIMVFLRSSCLLSNLFAHLRLGGSRTSKLSTLAFYSRPIDYSAADAIWIRSRGMATHDRITANTNTKLSNNSSASMSSEASDLIY